MEVILETQNNLTEFEMVESKIVTETPPADTTTSVESADKPELTPIEDVEWCFQFFNNEPNVFAYSMEGEKAVPLVLTIEAVETQGLIFTQNGMEFKIFPRPISEASKLDRANQKKNEI
jgi:hypothetical protein